MMKKKNKGKKALTAVGAVVAVGLTPGIIAASSTQGSNVGITAADVVAIDGTTYSFDELYAMQRGETVDTIEMHIVLEPSNATLYGSIMPIPYNSKDNEKDDVTIYNAVEQMPKFPGGEAALMKYINSHINYPPAAAMNKVQGNVIVQFVVNKDGSVGEVKVIHSVDKDLDREAIRVIKSLPKFTPGRQNGKAVNVWYTLPVPFKLK
jgi:TonB family protein